MSEKMLASDVAQTIFRIVPACAGSVLPLPLPQNVRDIGQWGGTFDLRVDGLFLDKHMVRCVIDESRVF